MKRQSAAGANGTEVTLEMVADAAGVSPSTVSRILNGTARVRESKVRAVNAAISQLQFVPNPVARSLARGKSMSVGVVTQTLNSAYYGEAAQAIETGLLRASYSPLFVSGHWRPADERKCIDRLLGRRVEGIILLTSCLPDEELRQLSRLAPLVLTGRSIDAERICCLDVDNTPAARLATEYLIGQGHRHIVFIAGPPDHPDAIQRLNGYKFALAAHKIPFIKALVAAGDYTEPGGYAAMMRLLDARAEFTAVFASNDESAMGAMLALYRRGRKVPEDVSLIGFDDLPASSFTIPPLTSLHRSIDEIGDCAARAMIDLIEGRPPVARVSSATLAIRESTRPLRG
jgi:LacI family transcriptional regulator